MFSPFSATASDAYCASILRKDIRMFTYKLPHKVHLYICRDLNFYLMNISHAGPGISADGFVLAVVLAALFSVLSATCLGMTVCCFRRNCLPKGPQIHNEGDHRQSEDGIPTAT